MAYRRRFRRSFRRSYRGGRRSSRGYGQGGLMFTAGGVALGYFAPIVIPQQDLIMNVIAVLPVKMPRMLRRVTGGYVLGRLARGFLGTTTGIGPFNSLSKNPGDFA